MSIHHNASSSNMFNIYDRGNNCIGLNYSTDSWVVVSDRNLKRDFRLFDNKYYYDNL